MNHFYLTTPLYYVNDKPHLGTAYTTFMADILARYHRLFGDKVIFLTGVDEHGQKIQQAAEKGNKTPQAHCDEYADVFRKTWSGLNISYDIFFRTTDAFHKKSVQDVLTQLHKKGDIYSDTYEGWYCVSEEIFYTEKELVNGKTPTGKEVIKVSEKNYFFRMSKYQQKLIDHIQSHPDFLLPSHRASEVLGFLRQPLSDLCISRPKSRLNWGIEIPFDSDYVTYVWFDALLNYATGVGLGQSTKSQHFETWWQQSGANHLIGKDILITHAVYWTTMLLAMDLRLPKTIFAHGWILNKDNEKMSKSHGSVMSPNEMVDFVGLEQLRYFLAKEIRFGNDAPISHELVALRVNADLANNIGNLLSRTTNLIDKFYAGKTPESPWAHTPPKNIPPEIPKEIFDLIQNLITKALSLSVQVQKEIARFAPSEALEQVMSLLNDTNRFLEVTAPWKLAKTDLTTAGAYLYIALEALRISAGLLSPVLPTKMQELLETIGSPSPSWPSLSQWGVIRPGTTIKKATPLFPRVEI